jgi:glutathione synthase/RimK-type ligase-like ATP-grasp enzyme
MSAESVRVGVLSLHESKETKAILNAVEALGHRPEWLREENTVVDFDAGRAAIEPDVDVVANRLLLSNTDQPAEALGIAQTLDRLRPMLNRPEATAGAAHKLASAASLSGAGLPFPRTVLALSGERLNQLRETFGDEVVYKTAIGTHGGGTWRVGRGDTHAPMVGHRRASLQSLVETDGRARDLRVYVVCERVGVPPCPSGGELAEFGQHFPPIERPRPERLWRFLDDRRVKLERRDGTVCPPQRFG